eukprot:gene28562-34476_t
MENDWFLLKNLHFDFAKLFRINASDINALAQDNVLQVSSKGKGGAKLSTLQTAVNQYKRLFQSGDEYDTMGRGQRLARIMCSWVFLVIAKSIALASPLYFKSLIEKGATADKELAAIGVIGHSLQYSAMGLILGYGAMKLASGLVQYVGEIILSATSTQVSEVLPRQAFASALLAASRRQDDRVKGDTSSESGKNPSKSAESRSGFARRALDRGLRASNQLLYRSIFNLLPAFVESFCVLILIIKSTNRLVGLTAAAVISTFVGVTSYIMSYRVRYHRRQLEAENIANGYAEDALSLAEVVASFGAMNIERHRYAAALRGVSKASVKVRRSFSALKLLQAAIMGIGSAALMLAAWKSHQPSIGSTSTKSIAGTLVLTQALFAQMCAPLDHVGQHFRDCVAAAEDLRDLERIVAGNGDNVISTHEEGIGEEIKSLKVKSPYILEVNHLTYAYADSERQMLSDVSLSIPYGGYSVGIVGPSGSGKTTLFRLLLGLEDIRASDANTGSIYVHGRDFTATNRVPLFSVVGQDNDLFRGLDLMQNIEYGAYTLPHYDNITDEEKMDALHNAAYDAQLWNTLAQSGGWRREVGPRGRLLSGGERQRVCLARALYREELMRSVQDMDTIVLMDEITSSLDVRTESDIIQSLIEKRVKKQRVTLLMIAHRLASVQFCDKIIVMKEGRIVESGNHAQLLALNGWYAEAWRLQSAGRSNQS